MLKTIEFHEVSRKNASKFSEAPDENASSRYEKPASYFYQEISDIHDVNSHEDLKGPIDLLTVNKSVKKKFTDIKITFLNVEGLSGPGEIEALILALERRSHHETFVCIGEHWFPWDAD